MGHCNSDKIKSNPIIDKVEVDRTGFKTSYGNSGTLFYNSIEKYYGHANGFSESKASDFQDDSKKRRLALFDSILNV